MDFFFIMYEFKRIISALKYEILIHSITTCKKIHSIRNEVNAGKEIVSNTQYKTPVLVSNDNSNNLLSFYKGGSPGLYILCCTAAMQCGNSWLKCGNFWDNEKF